MSKETLTQIIQTALPNLYGVIVNPVLLRSNEPGSEPGTVVYVVVIPQSDTIHQAQDEAFYRRDNATTRKMHRDEILDVLNRTKGPKLHLEFTIPPGGSVSGLAWPPPSKGTPVWSYPVPMIIYAQNTGKIALYSLYRLFLEPGSPNIDVSDFTSFADDDLAIDGPPGIMGASEPWGRLVRQRLVPRDPPIFPGNRISIGGFSVKVLARCPVGEWRRIYWTAVGPDMPDAHGGVVFLREDGGTLVLEELPPEEVASFFGV